MKKIVKKVFGFICIFILGAQAKVFADSGITIPATPSLYGPPPDKGFSAMTGGQIFSIVTSVLLFIIGLVVIFNKNITKKVKTIVITLISIAIITLLLLFKFVF